MIKYHQRPSSRIDQEDLALLLRLHEHLYGLSEYYVHVVIDEAQDLNLSEYFMIRRLLRDTASMTIVGDMSQGIYPQRGLLKWSSLMNSVLADKEIVFREMRRSYRSTAEITQYANPLLELDQIAPAEAVRQSGIAPIVEAFEEKKNSCELKVESAATQMKEWREHHEVNTIALLCKGTQHCQQVFRALNRLMPGEAVIIENESDVFSNKIVVIPVYLAKGLEFDACIVMDAEKDTYNESVADRHLLYVALTRPLHRLAVYHAGEIAVALK
jgi:DNA helicase-2/ATP-dependent DNA helicase PcrA